MEDFLLPNLMQSLKMKVAFLKVVQLLIGFIDKNSGISPSFSIKGTVHPQI